MNIQRQGRKFGKWLATLLALRAAWLLGETTTLTTLYFVGFLVTRKENQMVIAKIICQCGNTIRIRMGNSEDEKTKVCWNCRSEVRLTQKGKNIPLAYVNGERVEFPRFKIEFQE